MCADRRTSVNGTDGQDYSQRARLRQAEARRAADPDARPPCHPLRAGPNSTDKGNQVQGPWECLFLVLSWSRRGASRLVTDVELRGRFIRDIELRGRFVRDVELRGRLVPEAPQSQAIEHTTGEWLLGEVEDRGLHWWQWLAANNEALIFLFPVARRSGKWRCS